MNDLFSDIIDIIACNGYGDDVDACKLVCKSLSVMCEHPTPFWTAKINRFLPQNLETMAFIRDGQHFSFDDDEQRVYVKAYHPRTRLFNAVYKYRLEFVRMYIRLGANVNDKDYFGFKALDYARAEEGTELQDLLVSKGALSTTRRCEQRVYGLWIHVLPLGQTLTPVQFDFRRRHLNLTKACLRVCPCDACKAVHHS
jgi:hypothetical protein